MKITSSSDSSAMLSIEIPSRPSELVLAKLNCVGLACSVLLAKKTSWLRIMPSTMRRGKFDAWLVISLIILNQAVAATSAY